MENITNQILEMYKSYLGIVEVKNKFLQENKEILDKAKELHIIAMYKSNPFREQMYHFKDKIKESYGIDISDIPISKFNREEFVRETLDEIVERIKKDFWK